MVHRKMDIYTRVFRLTEVTARGLARLADPAAMRGVKLVGVHTICGPP